MTLNKNQPAQGKLLLSEPYIMDPRFERSVVLLAEHDVSEGTTGFVLNHVSEAHLGQVIKQDFGQDFPIFIGGPVEQNALFFIHSAYDKLQSGHEITDSVFWGGDFDRLILLIQEGLIKPDEIKFFAGYSGWEPGQLEAELTENSWVVSKNTYPELCFLRDGEDLWKRALIEMGPKYAHVANFPKFPHLN